jgi:hypothetical protein
MMLALSKQNGNALYVQNYLHISARGLWLFMGTLTVWLFTSGAQLIMGLDIYYRSEAN